MQIINVSDLDPFHQVLIFLLPPDPWVLVPGPLDPHYGVPQGTVLQVVPELPRDRPGGQTVHLNRGTLITQCLFENEEKIILKIVIKIYKIQY